jgi:hypothetical protein
MRPIRLYSCVLPLDNHLLETDGSAVCVGVKADVSVA